MNDDDYNPRGEDLIIVACKRIPRWSARDVSTFAKDLEVLLKKYNIQTVGSGWLTIDQ